MKSNSSTFGELPADGILYQKIKRLERQVSMNSSMTTGAIGIIGTTLTASGSFIAAIQPWQENVSWVLSLAVGLTTIGVLVIKRK